MISFRSLLTLIVLASQAPAALTDGLAAYYDFETNLNDKSGNARHLAIAGGTPEAGFAGGTVTRSGSSSERSTLIAGNALNLVDADGDYVKAPLGSGASATTAGTFNLGGTFTISAWHYLAPLPSNTSARYFVYEGETNYDISWGTDSGDSYQAYNAQTGGVTATLTRGAWHQIVQVFRTVDNLIVSTVYVDGQSIGEISANATAMDFPRMVIGNSRNGQDRKWDGLIDEVAVWNRALTSAEINELRARGLAGIGVSQDLAAIGKAYLDVSVSDPLLGSVAGTGIYNVGAVIQISVEPAPGYDFSSWTGGFVGKPQTFSHTVTASLTAVAQLTLSVRDDDGDGLSNYDEGTIYGTDPTKRDTDGDGIPDGDEIFITSTDPVTSDAALIQKAAGFFAPANLGAIALTPVRAEGGGTSASFLLSTSLTGTTGPTNPWMAIPLTPQALSVDATGSLMLRFPAPSPAVSSYQVIGKAP